MTNLVAVVAGLIEGEPVPPTKASKVLAARAAAFPEPKRSPLGVPRRTAQDPEVLRLAAESRALGITVIRID